VPSTKEPPGVSATRSSLGPQSREEREKAARIWLGGAASGGERLARIFRVGEAERAAELEAELGHLRAKLETVEDELLALRRQPGEPGIRPGERTDAVRADLPRVHLPRERDYRLSRCEGFAVRAGSRTIGVVEGVRYHSRTDRPDVLEVRGGGFGGRLLLVPVSDIESVDADEQQVVVKDACCPPQSRDRVRGCVEQLVRRVRR
jgi:hypothetical protein